MNKTYIQVKLIDGETKTYAPVRNVVNVIEQVAGLRLVDSSVIRLVVGDTIINASAYHSVNGNKYIDYDIHHTLFGQLQTAKDVSIIAALVKQLKVNQMSTMSNLHQQIQELAHDLGDEAGYEWATVIAIADELNISMSLVESVLDSCDSEFDDFDFEYNNEKEYDFA